LSISSCNRRLLSRASGQGFARPTRWLGHEGQDLGVSKSQLAQMRDVAFQLLAGPCRRAQAQQAPANTGRAGALLNCLRPAAATLPRTGAYPRKGGACVAAQRRRVAIASRQALCCSGSGISYGPYGIGKARHCKPPAPRLAAVGNGGRASKRRATAGGQAAGKLRGGGMLFRSAPKVRAWRHQMWCGASSGLGDGGDGAALEPASRPGLEIGQR
jgi:hypothetical protein